VTPSACTALILPPPVSDTFLLRVARKSRERAREKARGAREPGCARRRGTQRQRRRSLLRRALCSAESGAHSEASAQPRTRAAAVEQRQPARLRRTRIATIDPY